MKTTFKYSLEGQETERLIFRKLLKSDFDTWMEFCLDRESGKYISLLSKINGPTKRCEAWFERVLYRYDNGLGGMNVLIDKQSQSFVGQCGLLIQTIDGIEELEIGYSLMPKWRGKGYATEAARKCKEFTFRNNLSESLISVIHIDNNDSSRVAIANGMHLERTTVSNGDPVNIYRIFKNSPD